MQEGGKVKVGAGGFGIVCEVHDGWMEVCSIHKKESWGSIEKENLCYRNHS